MTKRKTKIEFITDSVEIHKHIYDYSKVNYCGNKQKVEIICKEHGSFFIRPNDHLSNRRGCSKCSIRERAKKQRLTQTEFETKAKKVHNNTYNYSKSKYETYSKKIIIICPIHGEFKQISRDHLSGYGCYECGLNKCGFLSLEYIKNNIDLANTETILYLTKIFSKTELFYKIGITTHTFKRRFKSHPIYTFESIREVKTNLLDAYKKEQQFKKDFYKYRYKPIYYFEGITECFKEEIYKKLFPS